MRFKIERNISYTIMILLIVAVFSMTGALIWYTQDQHHLANTPVDVLTDWSLTVDTSHTYQPGDNVSVTSQFTKLLDVTGDSSRYLQCHKPHSDSWDAFIPINITKGNQKHVTNGVVTSDVALPLSIGTLPNTCRVYFAVTYNVNRYHTAFLEANYTNTFTVVPRTNILNLAPNESVILNNDTNDSKARAFESPQSATSPQAPIVIYQNVPPNANTENAAPTTPPKQNLLQRVVGGVESLVNL